MISRKRSRRRQSLALTLGVIALVAISTLVVIIGLRVSTPAIVRPVAVLSGDWVPFSGPDLTDGGPLTEIMVDVLETAGFEPGVTFTTWDSAVERVAEGAAFGAFPLVRSEARQQRLVFSDALMSFDYVLFVRADDAEAPATAAELASLRVGGISGYDYWPEFEQAAGEVIRFPSTAAALIALAAGDIDVLAEGEISGLAVLNSIELDVDVRAIEVLAASGAWARSTETLHFVMRSSPDSVRALERINEAIAEVKKTPEYVRAMERIIVGTTDRVTLVSAGGGVVSVFDESGAPAGESPAGVSGAVIEWPVVDAAEQRVKVKLADGPLAGHIVWVEVRFVEVTR